MSSVPTTQKVLYLQSKFGSFEVSSAEVSPPATDEVLIRVESTSLNPVDWKIQTYGYFASDFPFISGTDAAGIVEEIGAEVSNVAKGDKM